MYIWYVNIFEYEYTCILEYMQKKRDGKTFSHTLKYSEYIRYMDKYYVCYIYIYIYMHVDI